MRAESPTFLDLFCGCGGFSLGLERAGFRCLAAIDFNGEAVATYKANFGKDTLVLRKDLKKFTPEKLAAKLGVNSVDVIVGGPPCQGFSNVRQNKSANHGSRVIKDGRRYLFRAFLDYVAAFRPRVFVMENVLGIQSAAKGKFFTLVQAEARALGYRVHPQVEEAWRLGVPQKRRRQLIIGTRNDVPGYFPGELKPAARAIPTPVAAVYERHTHPPEAEAHAAPAASAREISDGRRPPLQMPKLWDAIGGGSWARRCCSWTTGTRGFARRPWAW